jgi:replicative DNA helicase
MDKNTSKIDLDYYEKIVIYNSLFNSSYLGAIIDYLKEEHFNDKNKKIIIKIIKDFYLKRNEIPSINELKAYLPDTESKEAFKSVITEIQKDELNKTNFNKDELFDNTEMFLKERAVFNTLLEAAQKLDSGKLDSSTLLQNMEKAVGINLSTSIGISLLDDVDYFINELSKNESKISSGWKWLDNKLGGGFMENGRSLYVFMGETNVGKSIFLGNVAANIALQGKTALVISLEMSEIIYGIRFASKLTKIPMFEIKSDLGSLKVQLNEIKAQNKNSKILIKEFPPSTVTPLQIAAYIKKLQQRGIKIDCIVLDYLNLVSASDGNNLYEKIKYISEQLRALSYKFSVPVITATQINREGYKSKSPEVENISEGISLANTADAIIRIWQEKDDKDMGYINMGIIKNRFGPNFGAIPLKIDYSTLTLEEEDIKNDTDEISDFNKSIKDLED